MGSKRLKDGRLGCAAGLVLCIAPGVAQANAGVPMIFLVMPAMVISLVPIVIVEALYLAHTMRLTGKAAGKASAIANLVSTLVGIPLTWLGLVAGQLITGGDTAHGLGTLPDKLLAVTWQAPWLIPYESELGWMIPAAGLMLLGPFFLVSWWTEYLVARRMLVDIEARLLKKAVRNANLLTYGLLTLWPVGYFVTMAA